MAREYKRSTQEDGKCSKERAKVAQIKHEDEKPNQKQHSGKHSKFVSLVYRIISSYMTVITKECSL